MTVNSIYRQLEIEDRLILPIYNTAKALATKLSYEPVIYPPGRSGNEPADKRQITITVDFEIGSRSPEGWGGSYYKNEGIFTVTFGVPERNPSRDDHRLIKRTLSELQNYYSIDFCNDVEQMYLEDVSWSPSIDSTSRSEYILSIDFYFYDYPQQEARI